MKKEDIYSLDKEKSTMIENFIDRFTLPIAKFLVKRTNITANQVSVLAFLFFAFPAVILFSFGEYRYNLIALLLCFGYSIFDLVDGKIARLTSTESKLGAWLENGLDWLHTNLIPAGLVIGILQNSSSVLRITVCIIFITFLNINTYVSSAFEKEFNFYSDKKAVKKWYGNIVRENGAFAFEIFIKNVLDPHGLFFYFFFSIRYILLLGIIFNRPFWAIFLLAGTFLLKCSLMYYLFISYVQNQGNKPLIVSELRKISVSETRMI